MRHVRDGTQVDIIGPMQLLCMLSAYARRGRDLSVPLALFALSCWVVCCALLRGWCALPLPLAFHCICPLRCQGQAADKVVRGRGMAGAMRCGARAGGRAGAQSCQPVCFFGLCGATLLPSSTVLRLAPWWNHAPHAGPAHVRCLPPTSTLTRCPFSFLGPCGSVLHPYARSTSFACLVGSNWQLLGASGQDCHISYMGVVPWAQRGLEQVRDALHIHRCVCMFAGDACGQLFGSASSLPATPCVPLRQALFGDKCVCLHTRACAPGWLFCIVDLQLPGRCSGHAQRVIAWV